MKTVVLYQYPDASGDIRKWAAHFLKVNRIDMMNWFDPIRPKFMVRGSSTLEAVDCYPFTDLLNGNVPVDGVTKVVLQGAIQKEYIDLLSSYLHKVYGS